MNNVAIIVTKVWQNIISDFLVFLHPLLVILAK